MFIVYFCGFLFLIVADISQAKQTPYINEWVPLTKDEVYNRINYRAHFQHSREKVDMNTIDDHNTESIVTDIGARDTSNLYDIRNQAIRLVNPDTKNNMLRENNINQIAVQPDIIKSVNELQITDGKPYSIGANARDNVIDLKTRKPKAIPNTDQIKINNLLSYEVDERDDFETTVSKGRSQGENLYEVTEDPNEILDGSSSAMKTSGYFYTPPNTNLNNLVQNNITHKFLDILSRHNIKPEDELPNYTLSRRLKDQNRANAYMFIPVPLRVLPQFNNLKQLSVDPLLAVLMSNYGYYFPGSYGIHSRYRNLYGHLASNNIHNNKPFGSYKIFSDTDSSN